MRLRSFFLLGSVLSLFLTQISQAAITTPNVVGFYQSEGDSNLTREIVLKNEDATPYTVLLVSVSSSAYKVDKVEGSLGAKQFLKATVSFNPFSDKVYNDSLIVNLKEASGKFTTIEVPLLGYKGANLVSLSESKLVFTTQNLMDTQRTVAKTVEIKNPTPFTMSVQPLLVDSIFAIEGEPTGSEIQIPAKQSKILKIYAKQDMFNRKAKENIEEALEILFADQALPSSLAGQLTLSASLRTTSSPSNQDGKTDEPTGTEQGVPMIAGGGLNCSFTQIPMATSGSLIFGGMLGLSVGLSLLLARRARRR